MVVTNKKAQRRTRIKCQICGAICECRFAGPGVCCGCHSHTYKGRGGSMVRMPKDLAHQTSLFER